MSSEVKLFKEIPKVFKVGTPSIVRDVKPTPYASNLSNAGRLLIVIESTFVSLLKETDVIDGRFDKETEENLLPINLSSPSIGALLRESEVKRFIEISSSVRLDNDESPNEEISLEAIPSIRVVDEIPLGIVVKRLFVTYMISS